MKTGCNNNPRQSRRDKMKDKKSLVSYWNMKEEWGRDLYIDRCNLSERIALSWFDWEFGN
jgi:hypothetical protein